MSNRLLIERTTLFDKLAIVRNDNFLLELKVIARTLTPRIGQIYCAEVKSYHPTLEAAFVSIGEEAVFLPSKEKLKQGDRFLVQIQREKEKDKKPRATRDLTIAGKNIVLISNGKSVMISKKAQGDSQIQQLAKKLRAYSWEYGFLLRSHVRASDFESILEECKVLQEQMRNLQCGEIGLVYDPTSILRLTDSMVTQYRIEQILCNDRELFKRLQKMYSSERIVLEHVEHSLFSRFGIEMGEVINPSQSREDFSITVNHLEALCVIDVNSSMQNTALRTRKIFDVNRLAFLYIMKYIEQVGLGGMVLIDFISMMDSELKQLDQFITRYLNENVMRDRRIKKYPLNDSALLQLVIEKNQSSIIDLMSSSCPVCNGSGVVRNNKSLIDEMELQLHRHCYHFPEQKILIRYPDIFSENEEKMIENIARASHIPYNIERTSKIQQTNEQVITIISTGE